MFAGAHADELRETIAADLRRLKRGGASPLERRWYDSVNAGEPDYSIYAGDPYLSESWACWTVYARQYLLRLFAPRGVGDRSIIEDIGSVDRVVDLGCGVGYSTAALCQMWPGADVVGTNLLDTAQGRVAAAMARRHGFRMVGAPRGAFPAGERADVVFASEYFEHFQAPVDHLFEVLVALRPRVLLVASTFTRPSPGHFPLYDCNGRTGGARASRIFNAQLKAAGYEKQRTTLWNGRPAYWRAR